MVGCGKVKFDHDLCLWGLLTCVGFSVDPYLTGALAYETIVAAQSVGVITSTKVLLVIHLNKAVTDVLPALYRKRARELSKSVKCQRYHHRVSVIEYR